jgi:hypothetical protein
MLPFPHMMDLFAHKLAGLRGWSFALARILSGSLDSLFLGHIASLIDPSPLSGVWHRQTRDPIGKTM